MLELTSINNIINLNQLDLKKKFNYKKSKFLKLFFIRVELNNFFIKKNFNLEFIKILNNIFIVFFSNYSSVKKLKTINILFNFLVFNYKGIRHLYSLPVNGQRTWSNGKTSKKINNTLKSLIKLNVSFCNIT